MPASWNQNRLTAKLGIEYPIIQGPLGGLSSPRLVSAVSNFGGLGSFGAHGLTPEAIKGVIAQIRSLTLKPFAMTCGCRRKTKVLVNLMKTRLTEALRHSLSISQPWGRRVQSTNPIRGCDLRI